MVRSMLRPVVALLMLSVSTRPVWAADGAEPVAPSAAVAAAWAQEAPSPALPSKSLKALYGAYGALQALDMISTVQARNLGAREVNPVMDGGYARATATKALLAAASVTAVRVMAKKNRKAAFVTMLALNVATAAVVATNYRTAQKLSQR